MPWKQTCYHTEILTSIIILLAENKDLSRSSGKSKAIISHRNLCRPFINQLSQSFWKMNWFSYSPSCSLPALFLFCSSQDLSFSVPPSRSNNGINRQKLLSLSVWWIEWYLDEVKKIYWEKSVANSPSFYFLIKNKNKRVLYKLSLCMHMCGFEKNI